MTLVLKNFAALKKHLSITIKDLWHVHVSKGSYKGIPEEELINALHEPRRSELNFLWGVMNVLEVQMTEEQKATDQPIDEQPYLEIYYGALYVTIEHIKQNLHMMQSAGTLKQSLELAFRNSDEEPIMTPDDHQSVNFYSSLNAFSKLFFINGDSRKGFIPFAELRPLSLPTTIGPNTVLESRPNTLSKISPEVLAHFLHISFQFEETAQNKVYTNYLSAEKIPDHEETPANPDAYHAPKDIPDSAIAQFTSFPNVQEHLEELCSKERAHKKATTISALGNPNRIRQLETLQKVAKGLVVINESPLSENEKMGILAGFMLLVREEIGQHEYSATPLDPGLIPLTTLRRRHPVVHTELTTAILNMKDMTPEDAEALITAAKNFLMFMIVEPVVVDKKEEVHIRAKNIFSEIAGFNVKNTLELMETIIKSARSKALNLCIDQYQAKLKASLPEEKSITERTWGTISSATSYFTSKVNFFSPASSKSSGIDFDKVDAYKIDPTGIIKEQLPVTETIEEQSSDTITIAKQSLDTETTDVQNNDAEERSTLTSMNF